MLPLKKREREVPNLHPPDERDTIVAVATPPGEGGIAIVRVSGSQAQAVLSRLFVARNGQPVSSWPSHLLTLGIIGQQEANGEPVTQVDEAMAVMMRAPRSYTREEVAEIHCHGSPWILREVLRLAVAAGARAAKPGEFTRRAFENGRVDLAQAEAVMQLIGAHGEQAARAALRQMQGGVSRFVWNARTEMTRLLAGVEAALDFPEEVEEAVATADLRGGCARLAAALRGACNERVGKVLRDGVDVVIAGRPNVGKSTLLNALLGEERAIVTDIPGTTRDVLTERMVLEGVVVQLTDTAGLRESADAVESIGITRAEQALSRADVQLIVLDASAPLMREDAALLLRACTQPRIVVLNKGDLPARIDEREITAMAPDAQIISAAAHTGDGLAALRAALCAQAGRMASGTAELTQARHIEAAIGAASALEAACAALDSGLPLDMAAIDLRLALSALGSITGETLQEDVLGEIFASFCVGK